MRKLLQLLRHQRLLIRRSEQEKIPPASIPVDENMKKYIWNEYLGMLKELRGKYPNDFKDTPLEPKMPSDIEEIMKLRNSLYKYSDPRYGDSYW